jgi:hypothetical protein
MSEPRPPFDDRFPNGPPLNGCARCHRDMSSLTAFDQHFERWDGATSCRDLDSEADWLQDKRGRWTTQKLLSQAQNLRRHHFPETPPETSPDSPSES